MRVWEKIRVAYENDQPVEGTLVKKIKGGVVVDLMGVDAFLPGSQIALRRVPNIDELLGQKFEFKIIKLNKRRRNIVVSRRVILENERAGKREKLMKELAEGSGAEGRRQEHHRLRCIHRSRRRRRPAPHHRHVVGPHLASVRDGRRSAQELEVKVLDIDWTARAHLRSASSSSRAIRGRTSPRSIRSARACTGKVVSITNYGAFIELEPGIEGLVHISEMSWTRNVRHPSKLV